MCHKVVQEQGLGSLPRLTNWNKAADQLLQGLHKCLLLKLMLSLCVTKVLTWCESTSAAGSAILCSVKLLLVLKLMSKWHLFVFQKSDKTQ